MDGEIDYSKYNEHELVDMFGRTDPRWAPINYARLKELLVARGYIVRDGGLGPGSAVPSAEKLQALIGSASPIDCQVTFGHSAGLFSRLEPAHNEFELVGPGTLQADGIHVRFSGRRAGALGFLGSLFHRQVELTWHGITDVESSGSAIHFVYRRADSTPKAITLWLPDNRAAERLATLLPKTRSAAFSPQLEARAEFDRCLIAQSPQTPVTVGLVALNALVFLAALLVSVAASRPIEAVLLAFGTNYGPFTSDGEWWRLITSLFLHFGVIHLLFNMWALASFGPLVERLYGSVNYLLIYLIAGVTGSLMSISWRPDVNSAGASGAIFGILGALLAAQMRAGETFPSSVVRPLRNLTLVFTGYALFVGFTSKGIDNAAHLGGLTSGFLIGLVMARPITGERAYTRRDLRGLLQMVPLAVLFLAGGLWCAQRGSASLVGEGLYWHTVHWFRAGEHTANDHFNAALSLIKAGPLTQLGFAERLEHDVLPFWREASDRFAAVHLAPDSPNLSSLQILQTVSDGRVEGYDLFSSGLRRNDPKEMTNAREKLAQVDKLLAEQAALQVAGVRADLASSAIEISAFEDGRCTVLSEKLPCGAVGSRLLDAHSPLNQSIVLTGSSKATDDAVGAALQSLQIAGFTNIQFPGK
jgi:rhomboid protease GluP